MLNSFNEGSKGWTSFKSFVPDSGVSVAGKYMTSKNGLIWQHYWKEYEDDGVVDGLGVLQNGSCLQEGLPIQYNYCKERNNFYDVQYDSTIEVLKVYWFIKLLQYISFILSNGFL